jgi:hypothetical protein
MCRALKVLCVAEDPEALAELKRAAVSAEWELTPGATGPEEAVRQLHEERPHVVVAFGAFEGFVAQAIEAYPALLVVADRDGPGAVTAVSGRSRPGPVR